MLSSCNQHVLPFPISPPSSTAAKYKAILHTTTITMKVSVSLIVLIASCEAFVVQDGGNSRYARSTTELYKYRPTKWNPQQGSTSTATYAPWGGAVATPPAPLPTPASSGFTMDDLAKQWAAMNSEVKAAAAPSPPAYYAPAPAAAAAAPQASFRGASGPPKSFSVTRWNPRTGSQPMSVSGSTVGKWSPPTAPTSSSYAPPPQAPPASFAPPPQAYAAAPAAPRGGAPKSYSTTRWNPRTGSQPMSVSGSTVGKWSPPVVSTGASYSAPPPPVAAKPVPTGPSMADLAKSWATMNADSDSKPAPTPVYSKPAAPMTPPPQAVVSSAAWGSSSSSGPKNMYSVSKWNPRAGSPPVKNNAVASFSSVAQPAAPQVAAAPAKADPMAALAAQWAAMNRS